MIKIIKHAAYRHGYLMIIAAWLFTFSFILSNYFTYYTSPVKVQTKIQQYLSHRENSFIQLSSDKVLLSGLLSDSVLLPSESKPLNQNFGFFIYTFNDLNHAILSYWNTNQYYVDDADLYHPNTIHFVNYQNGYFELIKKYIFLGGKKIMVVGLIPIYHAYFIQNKYLQPDFDGFQGLGKLYEITSVQDGYPIYGLNGTALCGIQLQSGKTFSPYNTTTIILRTLSIILLLFFLNAIAIELAGHEKALQGFVILSVSVITLRILSYYFPFPFDFSQLPLFDPAIYASNAIHPSLGDLLINVVILFWLINFYKNNLHLQLKLHFSETVITIVAYVQIIILGAICFLFAGIIKSLVLDSKISFDVANFFSLDIYTVVSFAILCLLTLSFFSVAQLLLGRVYSRKIPLNIQLFIIAVEGLLYASIKIGGSSTITNIAVLAWLLVFFIIFYYRQHDIDRPLYHTTFFIFWVMFFAASVAAMVMYQNKLVEIEQRKRIAEKLASQADPSGENLLNIAMTNFDDRFLLQNFDRLDSDFTNKYLKDSLISSNFSGYLNKYETHIYTFDSLFQPLYNDDSTNYATIRTIVLRRAKPTSIPGLYTYTTNGNRLGYLFEKDIKSSENNVLGYFFVIVIPKKFASEALYPELFTQINYFSNELNGNYAYAVYNNGKIVSSYNDYSFPIQVNKQMSSLAQFNVINKNGYNELWYNAENGRQVLIVRKNEWILESLTLFAYLFCSFLLLIFLLNTVQFLLLKRFSWKEIKTSFVFDIRSQINLTIISISLFSFIVIGAATISFFINRFNKNKEDKLFKSVQLIGTEIQNKINAEMVFDDGVGVNDFTTGGVREKKIIDIAEMHNVDINYYDAAGNLKASTQPYIYNKHLLNSKMNPLAYYELHHLKKSRFEQDEHIGTLNFLSVYTPIIDEQGNTYAYLNIPYLNSQAELKQEISGFLATLINLNAFIFLVAGAIAFLITNRITASFSLIADKMKAISLGKKNEEITWKKQDELGVLIQEYNRMVHQLEESADALAKSEREGAWREMARQVAHEIKNPLTPMKLSIQFLQNAISDKQHDPEQLNSLTNRVTQTLIEQIDQLSKIAGDFSQFANIGNVQLEKFDVSDVLRSLVQLHSADNYVKISWKKEMGNYELYADKTQIQRLFTNLIKNAFEAVEGVSTPTVHVYQANVANHILISVTDNGSGIPDEFIGKIFSPNFTTKSSGTGLGLAICRGIVEKANGKIWFVTKQGIGTTFYVQIPIHAATD